jgi:hypothetical protein
MERPYGPYPTEGDALAAGRIKRLADRQPRGGARAADPALVRTRPFELTEGQRHLVNGIYAGIGAVCDTAEDGAAVLVLALSEFLIQSARPEHIPEAVETAIECLRYNTGRIDDAGT